MSARAQRVGRDRSIGNAERRQCIPWLPLQGGCPLCVPELTLEHVGWPAVDGHQLPVADGRYRVLGSMTSPNTILRRQGPPCADCATTVRRDFGRAVDKICWLARP